MALTNDEWVALMCNPELCWQDRNRKLEMIVRAELKDIEPALAMPTRELTELLFPEALCRGFKGYQAHTNMVRALMKLAKAGLSDCCTKDMDAPAKQMYGYEVRPWLWHAGTVTVREPCSACAGKGYV